MDQWLICALLFMWLSRELTTYAALKRARESANDALAHAKTLSYQLTALVSQDAAMEASRLDRIDSRPPNPPAANGLEGSAPAFMPDDRMEDML